MADCFYEDNGKIMEISLMFFVPRWSDNNYLEFRRSRTDITFRGFLCFPECSLLIKTFPWSNSWKLLQILSLSMCWVKVFFVFLFWEFNEDMKHPLGQVVRTPHFRSWGPQVQNLLEAGFCSWQHFIAVFHCQPIIVSIWLKWCWKTLSTKSLLSSSWG